MSLNTGPGMPVSLLERNQGTAPHPPDWNVWRISLDTYSANLRCVTPVEAVWSGLGTPINTSTNIIYGFYTIQNNVYFGGFL